MNKYIKKQLLMLAAVASMGVAAPAVAQVQDIVVKGDGEIPYLIDARKVVARSGFGLCWRTGYWTPAAAGTALANDNFPIGCQCDSDIVPATSCTGQVRPPPLPPVGDKIRLAADALFDFDKAVLKPEGMNTLDELVSRLRGIKLEVALIVGHTDRIGSDAYNQGLSERRAAAVKAYLVDRGIDPNRIHSEGKGETQPVTGTQCNGQRGNQLIRCLQPDRRVEIEVIGTR